MAVAGESSRDAKKGTTPRAVRKVPNGTSAYQAARLMREEAKGSGLILRVMTERRRT